MGPVSEDARPSPRGAGTGSSPLARGRWVSLGIVSQEVDRARCGHRGRRRARGRRLLRGSGSLHALLPRHAGRLPGAYPGGRGRVCRVGFVCAPLAAALVVGFGALLGGLLVFGIAPEAQGHGTDAAISAVHHNPRGLRFRAVVVKIVASALTIGSGGSGGREGPTGADQRRLRLPAFPDPRPGARRQPGGSGDWHRLGHRGDLRRPLGGAVLAAEILYRDDFDPTALLPCFIASAVSSVVFGAVEGFSPLFGYVGGYRFSDSAPAGLVCPDRHPRRSARAALRQGLLRHGRPLRPLAPAALGRPSHRRVCWSVPWHRHPRGARHRLRLGAEGPRARAARRSRCGSSSILPFAKILATGLSIGSGGSGGIFGPGMVIGAFLGRGGLAGL